MYIYICRYIYRKSGNNLYQNTRIGTKKSVNIRDKYRRMIIVKRKRDAPNYNTFYYNVIDYLIA